MNMTGPAQSDTVAADAVGDLYRAHGLGLIRFALMLVGDQGTAEDVVQEAFLALYRAGTGLRTLAARWATCALPC